MAIGKTKAMNVLSYATNSGILPDNKSENSEITKTWRGNRVPDSVTSLKTEALFHVD